MTQFKLHLFNCMIDFLQTEGNLLTLEESASDSCVPKDTPKIKQVQEAYTYIWEFLHKELPTSQIDAAHSEFGTTLALTFGTKIHNGITFFKKFAQILSTEI